MNIPTKKVVAIMYGRSASLADAKDYTSEEDGLPEGFRIEDIGNHENYAIADMYNGLRGAGFSEQHSLGLIMVNCQLMEIAYEIHTLKTCMDLTATVVSRSSVSPTSRLGVDFSSCSDAVINDIESKTENSLTKLLDCFGSNTALLGYGWLVQEHYAYLCPSKSKDATPSENNM